MSNPKVSVLMCVYNGERYLREAIESILNQSFTNFEFIIVNDASTDNTPKIIKEYTKCDNRIRIFENKENLGLTRSLNKGIKLTKGVYIACQDADDISLPCRLEKQVKFLDRNEDIGALGAAVELIDEQGKSLNKIYIPTDHESLSCRLLINNCFSHSTLMARYNILVKLGGYNEKFKYAQDYDLWWRFSNVTKLSALPEIMVKKRHTNSSITSINRKEQLSYALKTSITAVKRKLNPIPFDIKAYKKFWWAYHGYSNQLQRTDIKHLKAFWRLMRNCPGAPIILAPRLQNLSFKLLKQKKFLPALQLLGITYYIAGHKIFQKSIWLILKSLKSHKKY